MPLSINTVESQSISQSTLLEICQLCTEAYEEDFTGAFEALGPGGPTPIDGLTDIPIGPGAVITIPLESADALDTELILKSTNRVFVERSLPRGVDADGDALAGRSGAWALPSVAT